MSHDIACRITLFPPARTAHSRAGPFPSSSQSKEAYLHFIAQQAKSEREEPKESGRGSNENSEAGKLPEMERAANVD
jgi:hypothetical protein